MATKTMRLLTVPLVSVCLVGARRSWKDIVPMHGLSPKDVSGYEFFLKEGSTEFPISAPPSEPESPYSSSTTRFPMSSPSPFEAPTDLKRTYAVSTLQTSVPTASGSPKTTAAADPSSTTGRVETSMTTSTTPGSRTETAIPSSAAGGDHVHVHVPASSGGPETPFPSSTAAPSVPNTSIISTISLKPPPPSSQVEKFSSARPTAAPTAASSFKGNVTAVPTTTTTREPITSSSTPPTPSPTAEPPDPYPANDPPTFPDSWYFDYDTRSDARYGPGHPGIIDHNNGMISIGYINNAWSRVTNPPDFYWKEFDEDGFGPWKGTLARHVPARNMCGRVGMQSPIDVRENGASCHAHHEVRSLPGDYRVGGRKVKKLIQANKLRILYERRPCADLDDPVCQEPDPPMADFPNGWGGMADVMHVDIKIPSEHLIDGIRFDAEMQIYHLHKGRRRMPTMASMIVASEETHNYYFDEAVKAFRNEYDRDAAECAAKTRAGRRLVSDFYDAVFNNNSSSNASSSSSAASIASRFDDYETWAEYSTITEDPEYHHKRAEAERSLRSGSWDPHHRALVPSIHFYRYDGSLTEPPCGEWVSWFIADEPMMISSRQLDELKMILFTHVDPDCRKTSVHFRHRSVRPIQETSGRPVWKCTSKNFGRDK